MIVEFALKGVRAVTLSLWGNEAESDIDLRIDCNVLRLVLEALLSDKSIKAKMLHICDECPYLVKEKCVGALPLTLEDIYEPDEERR